MVAAIDNPHRIRGHIVHWYHRIIIVDGDLR